MKDRRSYLRWTVLALIFCFAAPTGCVRRTLTINTEPAGALVYLNDEAVGRSPVTTDFTWYGDYDVIVRQPGYQTLKTHMLVQRPWYQIPPIDFFFEVFWPGHIHDTRSYDFTLTPYVQPTPDELIERAQSVRDRALYEAE